MHKILAIDHGSKNIGLAISEPESKISFAYKTLSPSDFFSQIKEICNSQKVSQIIIGLPINLSGSKTQSTQKAQDFINKLKQIIDLPVTTVDERLSTVQASKLENKTKKNVDELSAQILLQNYLDKK